MAIMDESSPIWGEIDRAENYLFCGMFDEAASLASTILKQLLQSHNRSSKGLEVSESFENEWSDMLESAGMVLVQSMKQMKRVCFQLSEGFSTTAQGFLEEFVDSWMYADDQYHPLSGAGARITDTEGSCFQSSISVDKYLEVVELYVVTLLATTLKETDLAISWLEKAALPMEKRQVLLRRLQSMRSSSTNCSYQTPISPWLSDVYKSEVLKNQIPYDGHRKDIVTEYFLHEQNNTAKAEILKLYRKRVL